MNSSKKMRSSLILALTALIWGVAFVAQSVGMDYVGPFTFNAVRFMIGGCVLIPCIWFLRRSDAKQGQNTGKKKGISEAERKLTVVGGISCGLALFVATSFQQIGIMNTTVGKAGFITALYIVIVPVLGIFTGKKIPVAVWVSVGLATIGMYLLCINGGFQIGRGDFMVFLCALVFSVHIMIIDHFSPKTDGVVISCIQFFTAGICSGVVMLLKEQPTLIGILAAWKPILYAGVLSCGVAYTLQIIGQRDTEPTVACLILSLESVFSLLAGWVILGQRLSAKELFGCVLVFVAILLAQVPDMTGSFVKGDAALDGCEEK